MLNKICSIGYKKIDDPRILTAIIRLNSALKDKGSRANLAYVKVNKFLYVNAEDRFSLYSARFSNCPILIFNFSDINNNKFFVLGHVKSYMGRDIEEGQVNDIFNTIQENKLDPQTIVFSPREDSMINIYNSPFYKTYQKRFIIIDRKQSTYASAFVTNKEWLVQIINFDPLIDNEYYFGYWRD